MANSVDPDQTGAVCSGSTLFASLLNSRDGVLVLVLVLLLTRVLFFQYLSVLTKIHKYMYLYLLKYCYKKTCTHVYFTSTTA